MVSGVVLPPLAAAALGGESLHCGRSVVGVLLAAGRKDRGVGAVVDVPRVAPWSIAAMIGSVLGFFVLGLIRRMPMWVGIGTSWSRDTGISDGILPCETAPGVLGPNYRKRK